MERVAGIEPASQAWKAHQPTALIDHASSKTMDFLIAPFSGLLMLNMFSGSYAHQHGARNEPE
jgi:hypothetical protein